MHTESKLSVLIPDGESDFAMPVLYCLSQVPNLKVHILSKSPWARTRLSRFKSTYYSSEQLQGGIDGRLEAICDAVKRTKADVLLPILPGDELLTFGKIAPNCLTSSLLVPPRDMFEIVADKWRLAEFSMKNEIPVPHTIPCWTDAGVNPEILKLRFPVLLKPTSGEGGTGIKLFNSLPELEAHLEKTGRPESPVIAQSYVNGYDIDCSVLCKDGEILAYTIQKGFIPSRVAFGPPSGIEFLFHDQVFAVTQRLMKALNWSGVAHIDLRYDVDDKQPKVLEINPRFWRSLLGSLFAGVNFPYLACLASLGVDFPIPEYNSATYVSFRTRVELLKQRYLLGDRKIDPWVGKSGFEFILRDPLPELHKYLSFLK